MTFFPNFKYHIWDIFRLGLKPKVFFVEKKQLNDGKLVNTGQFSCPWVLQSAKMDLYLV